MDESIAKEIGLSRGDFESALEYFDADFYASQSGSSGTSVGLLLEYLVQGWKRSHHPSPWFDGDAYLAQNPDVAAAGVNPFIHYAVHGRAEGRGSPAVKANIGSGAREPSPKQSQDHKPSMAAIADEFDPAFYMSRYPDIRPPIDPLEHFALYGWKEGRNPTAWFSTKAYQQRYPDVVDNPFTHYVVFGREEGRVVVPDRFPASVPLLTSARSAGSELANAIGYPERQSRRDRASHANAQSLDIHWLIPDFSAGGGGHMTIFRMVRHLELRGHKCTIWIQNPTAHRDAASAYDDIIRDYQVIGAEVRFFGDELFEWEGDAVIATGWQTASAVAHCVGFREKFYFVQDFEPAFHPMGSQFVAAELTYQMDLACICAGPWLRDQMEGRGRWARHFWLACDHQIYRPGAHERRPGPPRIALYNRPGTPRRLVDFALIAMAELAKTGAEFEVHLFGSREAPALPFAAVNHGILAEPELADLYRDCDLGITFSATNYSLVPAEMMACGLPVVEFDQANTRRIFPEGVVAFAGPHPRDICRVVGELLANPVKRADLARDGREWASQYDWAGAGDAVEVAIRERLGERGWLPDMALPVVRRRMRATVVIPTLNAANRLPELLDRLAAQNCPFDHDIIVIDSMSDDATEAICGDRTNVHFTQVRREDFNHATTRNLAIGMARGEYVAMLTQDALPTDCDWLYNFVALLDHFDGAAGAFGRHVAWPDASPFVAREIRDHFQTFAKMPLEVSRFTDRKRWDAWDKAWASAACFFSDNNACLRKAAWQTIPYPDCDFGEDQLWARAVLEAGWSRVYSPKSVVFHSHDFDPLALRARAMTEAKYFSQHFGWNMIEGDPDEVAAQIVAGDTEWAREHGHSMEGREALVLAQLQGYQDALAAKRESSGSTAV